MGIREKRLSKMMEKIIKSELQNGNLPSSDEFLSKLTKEVLANPLHLPEYTYRKVRDGDTADSIPFNQQNQSIKNDLTTIYDDVVEIHNNLIKRLSHFDMEKNKMTLDISSLENELKEMILVYNQTGLLATVYDMFDNMDKVNQSVSSVEVNVQKHCVTIPAIKNSLKRIKPSFTSSFEVFKEIEKQVTVQRVSSHPNNALTDNANETWQEVIISEQNGSVGGNYFIQFKEKTRMNRLSFSLLGAVQTRMNIEFTPDNLNWFTVPYTEGGLIIHKERTIDFPTIEAEQMRLVMYKGESDFQLPNKKGKVMHHHVVGIKNVSIFELEVAEEGTLGSIELKPVIQEGQKFSINKVTLKVEEEVPNNTSIDYFVALPKGEGKELDWRPISPLNHAKAEYDTLIDFKNITRAHSVALEMKKDVSIGEYEMHGLEAQGISFYKLGEIKDVGIVSQTERLFIGKNHWGVKYFDGQLKDVPGHVPGANDWKNPITSPKKTFYKIENGKRGTLLDKVTHHEERSYIYTLGMFVEEKKKEVVGKVLGSNPVSIFLNGEEIFSGLPDGKEKTYVFNNGWNELVVFMYVTEKDKPVSFDIGFDPLDYASHIYASPKPLTKKTLFDLRYNTKNIEDDKYSLIETKVGEEEVVQVVINQEYQGIPYDLFFDQIDGDIEEKIFFKAVLRRDREKTNVSPKLKNYRLQFS